jgi:hypothetical protein
MNTKLCGKISETLGTGWVWHAGLLGEIRNTYLILAWSPLRKKLTGWPKNI